MNSPLFFDRSTRRSTLLLREAMGAATLLTRGGQGGGGRGPQYTIGGRMSGLISTDLVRQDNCGASLVVPANAASFSSSDKLPTGALCAVTLATRSGEPETVQGCLMTPGSGNVAADGVSGFVSCGPVGPLAMHGSDPAHVATGVSRSRYPALRFSPLLGGTTFTAATKQLPLKNYEYSIGSGGCVARGGCLPDGVAAENPTLDNAWKGIPPYTSTDFIVTREPSR